jgi:hypothetical protein
LRQAWAQHVPASYLRHFELWELAFKLSDFVVCVVVSCHPYFPSGRGTAKSVQVERTGGTGCECGRNGERDVTLAVEGDIWEGGCSAVKVDVGVVDEVGHGCCCRIELCT